MGTAEDNKYCLLMIGICFVHNNIFITSTCEHDLHVFRFIWLFNNYLEKREGESIIGNMKVLNLMKDSKLGRNILLLYKRVAFLYEDKLFIKDSIPPSTRYTLLETALKVYSVIFVAAIFYTCQIIFCLLKLIHLFM